MNTENQPILTITENAIGYLLSVLQQSKDANYVRISVKTAGCSGLKYELTYTNAPAEHDLIQKVNENLILLIDKKAVPYILGSTMDYVKEGLNKRIKFINPNEKDSCGCGESFYV